MVTAQQRTILAFDYGSRRIGVAIGNTLTRTARPLMTVSDDMGTHRFASIAALLGQWQPDALVVGRPLDSDGTPHLVTAAAERFARQLNGRFGLPVVLVDERYSTLEAIARQRSGSSPKAARREASDLDALAAAVILEQYLGGLDIGMSTESVVPE